MTPIRADPLKVTVPSSVWRTCKAMPKTFIYSSCLDLSHKACCRSIILLDTPHAWLKNRVSFSRSDANPEFFDRPVDVRSRLTYGMVDTILTGVLHVLCQEQNSISALFLVSHDLYVNFPKPVFLGWNISEGSRFHTQHFSREQNADLGL